MKIAIIGASGFVATRLIEHFQLTGGPSMAAVVHRPAGLALPERFSLETHLAEPLDGDAMARALSSCHAAILFGSGEPALLERVPAAVCMAVAAAGVRRVIYLSNAAVHGIPPAAGTDENTPLDVHQEIPLHAARVRAEQKFFAECERLSLIGFALRPGIVYGPRSRWISDLAGDLIEGRAWLYEGGRGICNAIYVDNLVAAISCCLHATDDAAGAYLVGDAEQITWEQFYRAAALQLDVPWTNVHQVSRLPEFKRSWQDKAGRAATHPFMQRLLPMMPYGLKRSAKAVLDATAPAPPQDVWNVVIGPRPRITQELARLQQTAWKFPHTRAGQNLDYHPAVTFAEGMERSLAWWRFAQGEISFAA